MSEHTETFVNNITNNIKNNSLQKEISDFIRLINELKLKIKEIKEQLASTITKAKNHEIKTNQGISLLEIKYHTLLEYITSLTFIIYMKLNGQSIQNHPVIENLIEQRIVIEKLKPLEQKLKYQIDKLIRATIVDNNDDIKLNNNNISGNSLTLSDPLSFKPNPQNLVTKFDGTNNVGSNTGVYKAPKLAPVHFEEDKDVKSKREQEESRLSSRASKSRLIKDLIDEYDDRPEESRIIGSTNNIPDTQNNDDIELEERLRYEEENFIRLTLSKKDLKKLKKNKRFEDEFENLNDFSSIATLHQDVEASEKERTSVLGRRNARRDLLHQDMSDGGDEALSSKRGGNKNGLFNGLISDPSQIKKRKDKFNMAKKNLKRQKRK
ncbi:5281_t:CDS:2 [Funneliformis caledonium]|uniref:5281_t:CDS:1 n=1 Tax=Funneliformis caledonium TaxID=1117310 RepID=A0A9N9FKI1_9GLOM|nr:5281_t:CDS:2 [Funneliformis caledonium]